MEISCNVIKDILPLYAEDMACEETKGLVEAHLCSCEGCRNMLAELKVKPEETTDKKMAGLKLVSDGIRKTKIWTVATAVLLVVSVIASLLVFLTYPVWATAEEAIEKVECLDDGSVKIDFTDAYGGIVAPSTNGVNGVLCWKVRWSNDSYGRGYMTMGNTMVYGEITEYAKETDVWYLSYRDGTTQDLLWDAGTSSEGIQLVKMSKLLLWIFLGVIVVFSVTALFGFLLRKKVSGRYFQNRAAVFGSFCISSLVVTSGRFMVYEDFWMKMSIIGILTVLMSATLLCGLHLWRLKKQLQA